MASQFHQRFRHKLSALLAGPAAAATALSVTSVARLEAQEESTPATTTAGPGVEFVGVFVDKESAAKLRAQYPSKFQTLSSAATASDDQLFLVLKYNPTDKEKEAFAPILGRAAQLHVKGYVEDAQTQAVVVAVTTETGDPIDFASPAGVPHVTIASVNGEQGLNSGYTSVLLERLRASGQLQWLLENEAQTTQPEADWSGELPAFESTLLPLFNPFPAVNASVVVAAGAKSDDEPTMVKGTVCVSSSFDPETGKCLAAAGAKAECGFCKFMKAGPCGAEFTAWEACLDKCKQGGLDFIEHCGKETLALRDCVDANPEYYSVLNESPEGDDAETEEEAKKEGQQVEEKKKEETKE